MLLIPNSLVATIKLFPWPGGKAGLDVGSLGLIPASEEPVTTNTISIPTPSLPSNLGNHLHSSSESIN